MPRTVRAHSRGVSRVKASGFGTRSTTDCIVTTMKLARKEMGPKAKVRALAAVAAVMRQFVFIQRDAESRPLRHDELKIAVIRPSGGNAVFEQERPE